MAVTTGKVRLSFCHLWEPYAQNPGDEAKYSVTILIPKSDTATLNAIYAEMAAAEQQGVASKWGGVKPPIVKNPLYDGDGVRPSGEPFGEECKGHMVMTASSKEQPSIVDLQVQPILNRADVYSGCYARVSVNFFAYATNGNKGIGCGLNAVQKLEDGEALAGRVSAQEAFGGANAYSGAPTQTTQYGMPQQAPVQYGSSQQTPAYQQAEGYYGTAQPMSAGAAMPTTPGMPVQGYTAAPMQGIPQQTQQMQIDPITGQLLITGGVMGI